MYLSSGSVMDGVAFSLWQEDGALRLQSLVGRICKLGGAGREVERGGGVWAGLVQLFSMKGDHFGTCILIPIMLYGDRISFPA